MAAGVRYLALLRGINVGGKNLIPMPELREAFEELGLDDVSTYIATGNVLFRAPRTRAAELAARLEKGLSKRFGIDLRVILLTAKQVEAVIEEAPKGFGAKGDRCDVIFLRKPLTVKTALATVELKEGVDNVWSGRRVLYFSRLEERRTSSRMNRIVGKPEYQNMSIRSWGTAKKLGELMQG